MKIKDLELNETKLIENITGETKKVSNVYIPVAGTEVEPVVNVFRAVGSYLSKRVHFTREIINEAGELPNVIVCVGQKCPICKLVKELWATNLPEAINKARRIKAIERVVWNVIPLGTIGKNGEIIPYDWDEAGKRLLLFYFGVTIKRQLEELFKEYGHAGALNGYPIALSVYKGAMGNRYMVDALKRKKRTSEGLIETVSKQELSQEELEFEVYDLETVFTVPDEEMLSKIKSIINVSVDEKKPIEKKRVELKSEQDSEAKLESMLCFGEKDLFNPTSCLNCELYQHCKEEIERGQK